MQNGKTKSALSSEDYIKGILEGNKTILARTITLIESNSPKHIPVAEKVLTALLPHSGKSIRIGITGVPGAGKSTFIDAFGTYLTEKGHKVAVLAIDPSSTISGGSILGDKTRMEALSHSNSAFIRPSPTGGNLGGVSRKTKESIILCEAAGYDIILVETVGVGQNEVAVRSMVDFFLLLQIVGAGDELQGIKKGIMELSDAILINKADGDNKLKAEAAKQDYNLALHYLSPATPGWTTKAFTCSALTGEGIPEIDKVINKFISVTNQNGYFDIRRQEQDKKWLRSLTSQYFTETLFKHPEISAFLQELENKISRGELPPTLAANYLIKKIKDTFFEDNSIKQT